MALAKIEREMAATGKGCLGKAADDEPVFVLRGKDRFAPDIVEAWANKVELATVNMISEAADKSRGKIKEARALAHTMRAWQAMNTSKTPD
jgi:hypothetical protein